VVWVKERCSDTDQARGVYAGAFGARVGVEGASPGAMGRSVAGGLVVAAGCACARSCWRRGRWAAGAKRQQWRWWWCMLMLWRSQCYLSYATLRAWNADRRDAEFGGVKSGWCPLRRRGSTVVGGGCGAVREVRRGAEHACSAWPQTDADSSSR
jgi:hypothetical protein